MALLSQVRVSQYVAVDSPVHRLDARTKILAAGSLILCALLVGQPLAYVVLAAILIGTTAAAHVPWRLIWVTYRYILLGILLGSALTAVLFPGKTLASTGHVLITTRGAAVVVVVGALLAALLSSSKPLPWLPRAALYGAAAGMVLSALFLSGGAIVHAGTLALPLRLVLLAVAVAALFLAPGGTAKRTPERGAPAQGIPARAALLAIAAAGLVIAVLPDRGILHAGPFVLSRPGATYGVRLLGQLTLLIFTTGLLTMTTPPLTLTTGLQRLFGWLRRFRVPVEEITLVVTLGLTFLPLIQQQLDQVLTAQLARGADFRRGSWEMRGRNALALFIPLLASNLRRADDLALAMEARGYVVGARRTHLQVQKMGPRDVVVLTVVVLISVASYLIWR